MPTVGETVPGYEASAFFGLVAPKGTPPEIVALNKVVNEALKDPAMLAKIKELGGIADAGLARRFRQGAGRRNRQVGKGGAAPPICRSTERHCTNE